MKYRFNKIMIVLGCVCFALVFGLVYCIRTGNVPAQKKNYNILEDKAVAWEEYIDTYNEYASASDNAICLMSKESVDINSTFIRGTFEGVRGHFRISDGYMDCVNVEAIPFESVEPYLYVILKSFDPAVDKQRVSNLIAGLDVKEDGFSIRVNDLGTRDNFYGYVNKEGGLFDISVNANIREYRY